MAIRDRWNRMMRRASTSSTSSSTSSSGCDASQQSSSSSSRTTSPVRGLAAPTNPLNSTALPVRTKQSNHSSSSPPSSQEQRPRDPARKKKRSTKSSSGSSSADRPRRVIHPSERPLTELNLQHQAMFANYTLTFGRSSTSGRCSSGDDVSPCTSRQNSFDMGRRDYV